MQPNFTLKKLGLVGIKIFAIALIFTLSTQTSFSQENKAPQNIQKGQVGVSTQKKSTSGVKPSQKEIEAAKRSIAISKSSVSISADNDAGRPNTVPVQNRPPSTEAVCLTVNGSLMAGDPTMGFRPYRDGVASVCGPVKACTPTGLTAAGTFYDVITFANPLATPQCITITFTNNGGTAVTNFLAVYQTPFVVPTAANGFCVSNTFLGDAGSSNLAGETTSFQITLAGLQSADILVSSVGGSVATGSYTLIVDAPVCSTVPCSGTPAPGNTISSVSAACPLVPFNLSLQNATVGSGVTYQWQSAPSATGPWTNILGATNPNYSATITATTFYRCNVTCSGNTGTSTPVGVTLNAPSACYCAAAGDDTSFEVIDNVLFGSIANASTSLDGYESFIAISTDVIKTQTLPITVESLTSYDFDQVLVWIDYNQNGSFSDPGELAFTSPVVTGPYTGNITIPAGALTGPTRMRIRLHDSFFGPNATPCGNSDYGQVEDYTVNILPCTPALVTLSPSNSSIACGGSTSFTAAAAGNVASYQWETRGDPTVPQTMTFTNNTPLAVPDGVGAGVYSTISVAGIPPGAVISNVSIRVNIDHTYVGDMENNIIAPNGVSMSLMAELDGGTGSNSSDNFTNSVFSSSSTTPISGVAAPRTGTFAADRLQGYGPSANAQTLPSGMPWSSLYTVPNGNWRLGLSDWFAGDVGTLNNWSITFTYTAPTSWVNVTNGGIYSGATTPTLSLANVPQTLTGNQYRAVVTGVCSGVDVTSAATLTVSTVVPVVTPASATLCLGSVQQLSLTNTLGNSISLSEGFNVAIPLPAGWALQNNSSPVGTTDWFQGNPAVFNAQNGAPDSYIGANFNNTTGANTISNWLFLPSMSIKNGDVLTFWTRTATGATFPDRLEVRASTNGASTNVGATATSVGDFTNLLLTVNSALVAGPAGYPDTWTQFTATVSGLGAPATGRMAFRYFVTNGGPAGANSNFIGIDNVVYTSAGGTATGTWTGPAGTMFTNLAATIPYTGTPASTIYVKPTVNSNYQVSFTTTTPCTSSVTTVPVNVVTPLSNVANPVNTSACLGNTATFTSATVTGGPFVRQWQESVNSGLTWSNIAGATGATLTLTNVTQIMNNNLYRVNYTAAPCAGTISSASAKLTVNPLPVVTISAPDLALTPGSTTVITGSSSPAAISWSWTRDGAPIAGTTNTQTVNINTLGAYQATAVDNQTPGCTAKSNILVIGSESSDRLWIYPNPTTGAFQARLYFQSDFSEKRIVTIYNSAGQEITSQRYNLLNITAPYLQMDFDLSKLARGTYVVKVVHEFTGKIVSGLVLVQ